VESPGSLEHLYIACSPGSEGQVSIVWFSMQIAQTKMFFNGHSLSGCLFIHLGQNILMTAFSSYCLLLALRVSR